MAWNEPGGGNNKPKDPWGGGDQGPPDLDEALKKLQDKLGGIFGGSKGRSGGSSGGGGIPGGLIAVVFGVAVVVWALMGFYQLDQGERAVVLRFGKYLETKQPGLHWNPPLVDEVIVRNVTRIRPVSFREIMLTQDENIVEVRMSVQYLIDDPNAYVLQVREPDVSLQHAAQSALRHVVGGMGMNQVLTGGRAQIAVDVTERLQEYLNLYQTGILVDEVTVDDSKPPTQVQAAFDDVIKAREDEERLKNEAEAYANGIVPEARGSAQRVLEEALAYKEQVIANAEGEAQRFTQLLAEYERAPEVTRERLYLESVQSVMSNNNKVMIDVEGGNNMMYLPLDRLGGGNAGGSSPRQVTIDSSNIRELTNAVTEQLRRDAAASSSRRGGR